MKFCPQLYRDLVDQPDEDAVFEKADQWQDDRLEREIEHAEIGMPMKTQKELETFAESIYWDVERGNTEGAVGIIQKIRLESMKEGMRMAAVIAEEASPYSRARHGILISAEQLTEKDL